MWLPLTQTPSDSTTLHLLPPVLAGAALPPVIAPRQKVTAANAARKNFMKTAMKSSGVIPGRGALDGRKKRA